MLRVIARHVALKMPPEATRASFLSRTCLQLCNNLSTLHASRQRRLYTAPPASDPHHEHMEQETQRKEPAGSPLYHILASIQEHKHKKWGLLFYRCDYTSDELWQSFLRAVKSSVDEHLDSYKGDGVRSTFEMTLIEDKATLDGATIDQVCHLFTAWVRSGEAKDEMSNSDQWPVFSHPRYTYCVHVDADVLDAVVNRAPKLTPSDALRAEYVDLIQLRTEDFRDHIDFGSGDDNMPDDDVLDPEFVTVPLYMIAPYAYDELYNLAAFEQYTRYRDDDDVALG